MEAYGYKIEDFYWKHGYEGGLSTIQVEVLYTRLTKRQEAEMRFQAALVGVELTDNAPKKPNPDGSPVNTAQGPQHTEAIPGFTFKDPREYDHLSQEERQAITEDMMDKHKTWKEQGGILKERG